MDKQAIIEELINIVGDCLKSQGFELVDLIHRYEGRDLFLRILADRPEGGITLDECSRINKQICGILDRNNIISGEYILEVFSPGIDRPLKNESDFSRSKNRKVKFYLCEAISGRIEIDGVVKKVEEDEVYVEAGTGLINIPLSKINKARQII